jgi:hypothetical protein
MRFETCREPRTELLQSSAKIEEVAVVTEPIGPLCRQHFKTVVDQEIIDQRR